jgi:hypothetical protein
MCTFNEMQWMQIWFCRFVSTEWLALQQNICTVAYVRYVNIKTCEVFKIAKMTFGKYVYLKLENEGALLLLYKKR